MARRTPPSRRCRLSRRRRTRAEGNPPASAAEFDRYAAPYRELLRDPVRDWFAPQSSFFDHRKWILLQDYLRRHCRFDGETAWLDVGCGQGNLLRLGRSAFGSVAGCDPSEGMLRECGDLDVRLQHDANLLPFGDRSFDLVTAVCVYHHVPSEARPDLTVEMARVLKSNGVLAIVEHNPFNPVTQLIVRRTPVDANARLLSARECRRLMARAGLDPGQTEYFLYLPAGLYYRAAFLERWLKHIPAGGQYVVFGRKSP